MLIRNSSHMHVPFCRQMHTRKVVFRLYKMFQSLFCDLQVIQRPDEATVAFSNEDAASLPQGTIQPHSSL